jgi:uncharacterized protein (DUF433 family)
MVTAYQSGKTTYEIAAEYDCGKNAISNLLKKHSVNVTKCKAQKRLDVADVVSMYENKRTSQEIANKYGVSPQVIIKCLRAEGVGIRGRWDY